MDGKIKISQPEVADKLFDIDDEESFFMELFSKEPFDACRISKLCLCSKDMNYFSTWGSIVEGCRFNDAKIFRGEFYDTVFKGCDFSGCDLTESFFKRCVFKNCKGVGVNLSRSNFTDVVFENGAFDYANLNISKMTCVRFSDTSVKNGEISGASLGNTIFEECDFTRVNFAKTLLAGIDFTSCDIEGIMLTQGFTELKGAIMTSYQASRIAEAFGIIIR